jgi:hypothetical protein
VFEGRLLSMFLRSAWRRLLWKIILRNGIKVFNSKFHNEIFEGRSHAFTNCFPEIDLAQTIVKVTLRNRIRVFNWKFPLCFWRAFTNSLIMFLRSAWHRRLRKIILRNGIWVFNSKFHNVIFEGRSLIMFLRSAWRRRLWKIILRNGIRMFVQFEISQCDFWRAFTNYVYEIGPAPTIVKNHSEEWN